MESQERHRKISDGRRLIRYQRKGHKLSTQELDLIERYREKERIRQQSFRDARRLLFPPKKRGRKPSAKSTKLGASVSMVPDGSHLSEKIERQHQENVPQQSVASAVDVLINGYNCYRGICFAPIDSGFLANDQHTINFRRHREDSSETIPCLSSSTFLESASMPEQHRSTSGKHSISSPPVYPATNATNLSVFDIYSLAASGTSPTPSCISSSSISSSGLLTVPSTESPESSDFDSQIGTLDQCQAGLNEDTFTSVTSDHGVSNRRIRFPSDAESSNWSTSSRDCGCVTGSQPSSATASLGISSHSTWTYPEIVQESPVLSKLQRCELLPHHLSQLRGLLQALLTPDKDRAFDEIVAFVNRVVEEAVDEVRLRSTSGSTISGPNDKAPLTSYDCARILQSSAHGEIHDVLYEFTKFEQEIKHA
ncbi:hypothetical protein V1525DRAFT_452620 [Lipomyces kononenkoae]|uniref:Uncharacterized protein n=1 Tax=Lipomyces kononenkoae TaxID=34357 RepID=A0ACC3SSD7_LIPKO